MKKLLIAGIAVAVTIAAQPAFALATATASITGFSFTLIDLDLTDGITPALTFTGQSSQVQVWSPFGSQFDNAAEWFTPLQSSIDLPPFAASSQITATGGSASASNAGTLNSGDNSFVGGSAYPVLASISITPRTGVIFRTSFAGSATTTVGQVGNDSEFAFAEGYMYLFLSEASGGQQFISFRNVSAGSQFNGNGFVGESNSFNGVLEMTYANFSSVASSGSVFAYAAAYASSTLPIPEPGTWALMLAGLLGVSAATRRKHLVTVG